MTQPLDEVSTNVPWSVDWLEGGPELNPEIVPGISKEGGTVGFFLARVLSGIKITALRFFFPKKETHRPRFTTVTYKLPSNGVPCGGRKSPIYELNCALPEGHAGPHIVPISSGLLQFWNEQ
jgi:hypothetical protein